MAALSSARNREFSAPNFDIGWKSLEPPDREGSALLHDVLFQVISVRRAAWEYFAASFTENLTPAGAVERSMRPIYGDLPSPADVCDVDRLPFDHLLFQPGFRIAAPRLGRPFPLLFAIS